MGALHRASIQKDGIVIRRWSCKVL